jgi:hypothetical protein
MARDRRVAASVMGDPDVSTPVKGLTPGHRAILAVLADARAAYRLGRWIRARPSRP